MKMKDVSAATIRRWIVAYALDVGDYFHTRSVEHARNGDVKLADFYDGMAKGAWSVVKGIRLGSFKPAKRPRTRTNAARNK